MNIQDRIRTIIKVNNLNASSFADKIGVQSSGVSHVLNGRNKPSLDFIEKVLHEFPRVDAGWLITGKSPKIVRAEKEPEPAKREPDHKHMVSEYPADQKRDGRSVVKIVIFYDDRSFEEFTNSHGQ